MAELLERVKLNLLVNGNGIVDNYKNNSLFFYDKYQKSDKDVRSMRGGEMQLGGFYFLHYQDDSNWMKYSPIFTVDFKKFGNKIIILAVNFNFIPIEIRTTIFDKFISEEDFEKDNLLEVNYQGMYDELRKYGFEYAICEYNLGQILFAHKICLDLVPRFLYAGHPINKYDPKKLYEIWKAKIANRDLRDQEMSSSLIDEFFEISDDINKNYNVLKGHIQRLVRSINKYG
jgi:hypothetical protein